jgi:hypothetical protein
VGGWDAEELDAGLLWRVAEFSGVEIMTYVLMSNHFHILVRVPEKEAADAAVTDAELIRRVGRLNGERAAAVLAGMQPEVLRAAALKLDGHPLNPAADRTVVIGGRSGGRRCSGGCTMSRSL